MKFYLPGTKKHEKDLMNIFLVAGLTVLVVVLAVFAAGKASLFLFAWAVFLLFVLLVSMESVVVRIYLRNKKKD